MKVRATRDLAHLDDTRLFDELARGCALVHENANDLWKDSSVMRTQSRFRSAMLLRTIAEEEAAKYLILVDVARCPRSSAAQLSEQLWRFNDHLAKGIYAEYADAKPADFAEVRCYVDQARETLYLDGPDGINFICRNDIYQRRERLIYVESEDGHDWTTPCLYDDDLMVTFVDVEPPALRKINVMQKAGFSTPEALAVIADQWRRVKMHDGLRWTECRQRNIETLERLEQEGLLKPLSPEEKAILGDEWVFPMYSLDMKPVKVDRASLRDQQRAWVDQQMGF